MSFLWFLNIILIMCSYGFINYTLLCPIEQNYPILSDYNIIRTNIVEDISPNEV